MHLRVIDGYNILFTFKRGQVGDIGQSREQFIRRVDRLAEQQKIKTLLVFDGRRGSDVLLPRESHGKWLNIIYTGTAESADDAIIRIAEDLPDRDSITVVTSDREVILHCKGYRTRIQRAMPFLDELHEVLNRTGADDNEMAEAEEREKMAPEKRSGLSKEGVDFWMRYFQAGPEDECES